MMQEVSSIMVDYSAKAIMYQGSSLSFDALSHPYGRHCTAVLSEGSSSIRKYLSIPLVCGLMKRDGQVSAYSPITTSRIGNPHILNKSSSPNIFYTKLPEHHRSNKSLPSPFTVLITSPVPDGTIVTVAAGNDETPSGEVRHETAKVIRQVARFTDLRFVGKSGRGKNFHLTICVNTKPMMIAMVSRAIKVTVDGPREARTPTSALTRRRSCSSFSSPVTPFFHAYHPLMWFTPDLRAIPALLTRPAPNDSSPEGACATVLQATAQEPPRKRSRKQASTSPSSSPPIWRPCSFE
ncbi:hypothetical protein KIN20_024002 [Parelaphostrongylus tenuis]|uniref:Runt domain-containing protein n=1 Tax=Parelaphostrongylus tenuis TaxID=148309 RepID=A0AAD5MSL5_PARTN|nr:hypothetical protein KIN20_024002 [Parelaphostrongylus tenuis]